MPAISCKCGERLSFGEIPNPIEWLLISDNQFDVFRGSVDVEEVFRAMTHLLRCPTCDRLWVFWEGFDGVASEYKNASTSGQP